ncbi:MAG: MotA/TolQ/ExbB proton channel family protein [Armatimonadota bacterium]|nr:MotA/TolQ/ExbB proton channel family protein [Armatimonadota bacterium]
MGWLVNAYDFLCQGGLVMAPLMACSIISLAVTIERFTAIRTATIDSEALTNRVQEHLLEGETRQALKQCEHAAGLVGNVLASALRLRVLNPNSMERAMQEEASKRTPELRKRLSWLDTIITIAPLLGLLGTVTGMIGAFHVISTKQGMSAPTAITGGVAEALIATAAGLIIAIGTLIGYNSLNERVSSVISDAEARANQLINIIGEIGERKNEATKLSA